MEEGEDRMLPIANVGRIMKQILPANAKISKEAKQTIQESATEFISFVTAEASDKCQNDNRKTLNGDDICWALTSLGFDQYADVLVRFLHKFREAESEKPNRIININEEINCSSKEEQEQEQQDLQLKLKQNQKKKIPFSSSSSSLEFRVLEKGNNGGPAHSSS